MSTKFTTAYIHCHGIKGRDRKVKFHVQEIKEYPRDMVDKTESEILAKAWVKANIKDPRNVYLTFIDGELDGIFRIQTFNFRHEKCPVML